MLVLDGAVGDVGETTIIRRSRFVATLARVESEDDVVALRERVDAAGANHVCWAYVLGSGPHQKTRSSDDGEPAGTAGPPILAALVGREVVNAAVVVVRWFGGVKLGAGGLIRAYGGAASAVLDVAPLREAVPSSVIRLRVPVDDAGRIATDLHAFTTVRSVDYGPCAVEFVVEAASDVQNRVRDHVLSATSGAAEIVAVSEQWA
ncbi:YigZ family protein [Gordonia humi]|uniref:Putative YigZ family protein n=1 Tax=Gordonia humi TaxID=686429 RepID=A0A840EV94_9ACTN|nr:putative YigZ family protein [Gordonia humi]